MIRSTAGVVVFEGFYAAGSPSAAPTPIADPRGLDGRRPRLRGALPGRTESPTLDLRADARTRTGDGHLRATVASMKLLYVATEVASLATSVAPLAPAAQRSAGSIRRLQVRPGVRRQVHRLGQARSAEGSVW